MSFGILAQKDTLDYTTIVWKLSAQQTADTLELDTFLHGFQNYNPIYKQDFYYAFNGTAGQAAENTFFLNRPNLDFIFWEPYAAYLFRPNNTQFYNTKQQYTHFQYFTNFTKKNNLQNIDLLHTQNITHYLNLGIQYRLLSADGEYQAQKTSNHFFRAFGSLQKHNYEAYIVYHYNKLNAYLNGGLTSDTLLDNNNLTYSDRKLHPVFLDDSKNAILGRNLNLRHHYNLDIKKTEHINDTTEITQYIPRWQIGHELNWDYNKRLYSNEGNNGYYDQYFIDTTAITGAYVQDSTGYTSFDNQFYIKLIDDSLTKGLPAIYLKYKNRQVFFHSYQNTRHFQHHIAELKLVNEVFNKRYWHFGTEFDLSNQNFAVDGMLKYFIGKEKLHYYRLQANFSHTKPNEFMQYYHSNFYYWDNQFTEDYALSTFDAAYLNKKLKLEVGVKQCYLDNYVYMGGRMINYSTTDSTNSSLKWVADKPHQETSTFGILTFYLNHQLDWGPFHMYNAFAYQSISNDSVLHLPKWQWYNSTYFQMHFFKKVLKTQIGVDTRLAPSYYTDGFSPGAGLYYLQEGSAYSSYPYIDLFVNLKLKRARIFFKIENINKGYTGNQYYTVFYHPMNPRVIRFGLSWRFYN
ncbi:MAG: hypothetical protein JXR60_10815 [Bacteroidales bacterium]|nr:hypothetical protein [Bacteroidales bacterium]